MSLTLAVALLALLVGLFALVTVVAVYARVRAIEAGRAAAISGYAPLVGRAAPSAVWPREGQPGSVVAVLDADCALCHAVWQAMVTRGEGAGLRFVAVVDRAKDFEAAFAAGPHAELIADAHVRAELFEGYTPTLLAIDPAGRIRARSFCYTDTDLAELLGDLTDRVDA